MTDLGELTSLGQSPWLDNMRRDWILDGTLDSWVDSGISGVTSNPSIFQKAIAGSTDYDQQFGNLIAGGVSVADAYWTLVTTDIEGALAALRRIYDATGGSDGFVSVEVDRTVNQLDHTLHRHARPYPANQLCMDCSWSERRRRAIFELVEDE